MTVDNTDSQQDAAATENEANAAPATDPIETLKAELKEQQNKYLYLYAEFENYKKRTFKERSDLVKFGHESFARELLHVTDNLDRALEHTANVDALVTGIKMVNQQLKETLTKFGVTSVSALGSKFDPQLHEAVGQEKIDAQLNNENVTQDGTIVKEHQKGYTLHGRLLRPARVVVAVK